MTVSVKKNVNGTTVEQTQKLILYSMYEALEEQFSEQRMAVDILTQKVKNSNIPGGLNTQTIILVFQNRSFWTNANK